MRRAIVLCIALVMAAAAPVFAQNQDDISVEFEGIYWFSELRANAQVSGETRIGTPFSLENDLGLGDRDIPGGRFTWYTGPRSRLFLEYSQNSFQGQTFLSQQIVFQDTTYNTGTAVSSDLKLGLAKFGWIWQFIDSGHGMFRLGTLLEARAVFADLSLTGQTIMSEVVRSETTANVGLPALGLALDVNPSDWMNLFAKGSGMSFGRYGYLTDAEAGIKLIPVRNLSISGGYRYSATEARSGNNDTFVRLIFKGPFAAASLRF